MTFWWLLSINLIAHFFILTLFHIFKIPKTFLSCTDRIKRTVLFVTFSEYFLYRNKKNENFKHSFLSSYSFWCKYRNCFVDGFRIMTTHFTGGNIIFIGWLCPVFYCHFVVDTSWVFIIFFNIRLMNIDVWLFCILCILLDEWWFISGISKSILFYS